MSSCLARRHRDDLAIADDLVLPMCRRLRAEGCWGCWSPDKTIQYLTLPPCLGRYGDESAYGSEDLGYRSGRSRHLCQDLATLGTDLGRDAG